MQQQPTQHMKQLKKFNVYGPCANILCSSHTGSWRIERPQVDTSLCIKCGICSRSCPVGVITIDKQAEECVQIDWRFCKGCGICANECPKGSISMVNERGAE